MNENYYLKIGGTEDRKERSRPVTSQKTTGNQSLQDYYDDEMITP